MAAPLEQGPWHGCASSIFRPPQTPPPRPPARLVAAMRPTPARLGSGYEACRAWIEPQVAVRRYALSICLLSASCRAAITSALSPSTSCSGSATALSRLRRRPGLQRLLYRVSLSVRSGCIRPPRPAPGGLRGQPLPQGRVNSSLPTRSAGPECADDIGIEPDGDLLFGGSLVRPTSTAKSRNGGSDSAT